jgi:hypothetical protein
MAAWEAVVAGSLMPDPALNLVVAGQASRW